MKKTLSTMAAAAVLMASTAIAPAFAQSSTTAPAAAPNAQQMDTTMPKASGTTNSGAMNSTSGTASTTSAAASGEYITQQSETQVSANDYIGKAIYNAENNSIGDVNDLILEENGGIVAAVVGVGGFLGIGEKDVAVPMSKLTMARDENNNVRLTTTETADSLKAAPEFKTLSDQQAEMRSNATDTTTTSSTGGAAPAGNATTPSTQARP
ncbi:photosystem reaction center subunit H [Rhizobium sp. Root149]|uniref:PRC-barrel domain-containing protein n=1 Tax=Rhizobium sp. Root149 TaxID=1736473 RepID=UPI0007124B25|nr:PRC-barrel domain-containing protein [Rhizobium sp. Root149]KQZ63527.1 photosystem reaction center subunit H [Rhizobium sp. Root149]